MQSNSLSSNYDQFIFKLKICKNFLPLKTNYRMELLSIDQQSKLQFEENYLKSKKNIKHEVTKNLLNT